MGCDINSNSETVWIPIPENKPFSIMDTGPPGSRASNGDNIASASIADNQKKCANLPFKKKTSAPADGQQKSGSGKTW